MKENEFPIEKLSRRKFADALQKGLGRAYLHAKKFGIDEVADLVLKACLLDEACDPQAENSKAQYLTGMFWDTPYLPKFREAILNALRTKRNTWDVNLVFKIALYMANTGDVQSRVAIRDRALKKAGKLSEDDWLGAEEWISLAGIEGAIELATIYGSRLLKNAEDYVPEDEIFPNDEIKKEFWEVLLKESAENSALEAYRNYLDKRNVFKPRSGSFVSREVELERRKQATRKIHSLDSILKDASNKIDIYGARFNSFGWAATEDELAIVYKTLLDETDNAVIWRLLRVFSRVPLPGLDEKIFSWTYAQDRQVSWSAIHALAQNHDYKIHQLALEKIKRSNLKGANSRCIELFVNNYENEDAELITAALFKTRPTKEDAHSLAWDVISLSEKYQDSGLADALKWAYEKTPCSNCRYRILKQLDSLGQFNGAILYECQFDSSEEIIEFAQEKLAS